MYILEIKIDDNVENVVSNYYKQLQDKLSNDSGVDLVAVEELNVKPFEVSTINFKIKCQMINTENNQFVPYYLYPRSSISKTPLIMANSVGIIDSEYRGNIMAKVRHIPFQLDNQDLYKIDVGTRLFQICAPDLSPLKVKIVNDLTSTSRGEGGFGSTGNNLVVN